MLKDISSINIVGANFAVNTSLDFFNPHDGKKVKTIKGALLYGRNGTGKSTIARAFRKIAGEDVSTITSAKFCDDGGQNIALSEDEKQHIFIFDEDFVDKNVKLKQDHLETIVMLGPTADLTEKLEKAESERNSAKIALDRHETTYKEYCDNKNPKSPEYYITLLGNALRGDDNWSGRDREINNTRQNSDVRKDTYKRFTSLTPSKPKTELIIDYKIKLGELKNARTGALTIDDAIPPLPKSYSIYDDRIIQTLLSEKIEKPELSEREKKLFTLVQTGRSSVLSERLSTFRAEDTTECPYCYQPLSPETKSSLIASIEKVLSKAVEEHQTALRTQIFDEVTLDLSPYSKLPSYQMCLDLIEKINAAIKTNNASLNKKLDNPYEPIIQEISVVGSFFAQLAGALKSLEKERVDFNDAVKSTEPIIKELNRLNSEIAYYDTADLASQLEKQKLEYNEAKELYETSKTNFEIMEKAIEELEAQRRNVRLALDSMNACMKYIFFAEDRLKIDFINGTYKLLSHGKSVKPCEVSVGERNIIGLSYFFTNILEGKEEKNAYGEEYLLVIDDPVSSYDIENSVGILSFLKYKLGAFLEGNPNTKVLVMTHDLMTFYNIQKVLSEIITVCKQAGYSNGLKFNLFEIRDNSLSSFSYHNRHEYTEIIKAIYDYASSKTEQHEPVIGNMMRQALEAFSTFEYKKSIEDVSRDVQILKLMREPKYESYYKNLMYRLVLHGGSHREEQIKTMKDFNFFNLISKSEKIRTAKDILCFIYLLNSRHLLEHLKEYGDDVESTLQVWCQDIKSRAAII